MSQAVPLGISKDALTAIMDHFSGGVPLALALPTLTLRLSSYDEIKTLRGMVAWDAYARMPGPSGQALTKKLWSLDRFWLIVYLASYQLNTRSSSEVLIRRIAHHKGVPYYQDPSMNPSMD